MQTILHIIPTLEGGGAERQLSFLAYQHAKRGCIVHLAIRRGGVNLDYLNHKNIKIHYLGDYSGLNPILFLRIFFLVRKIKPEIIQTWLDQMDILGGVSALILSIPWVLSERSSGKNSHGILDKFRKFLGNYCTCIIANSINGASYWKSLYPMNRILYIPNAIDFNGILKSKDYPINDINLEKKIILVVGRFNLFKGMIIIINSISLIRSRTDYRVVMIGEGPLKKYIIDLIEEMGLSNSISVLNYDTEWWKYLFKASVFISMSDFEGQPNSVLEAVVARTPLILSSIKEHHELVHSNDAIFIKDKNIFLLSDAIIKILNNKNSSDEKLRMTFNKISACNFERIADSYLEVYSQLLTRNN